LRGKGEGAWGKRGEWCGVAGGLGGVGKVGELVQFWVMTQKYMGTQQSLREVKPEFIDSTQGEPKNIYKP
jgi:hypothetical protein